MKQAIRKAPQCYPIRTLEETGRRSRFDAGDDGINHRRDGVILIVQSAR
jgi:hypothetical protein